MVQRWSRPIACRIVGPLVLVLLTGFAWDIATAATPVQTERGRKLYGRHCMECHGIEGRGDGIRAPFLSPRPGSLVSASISAKSDQELLRTIRDGKPRTAMRPWRDVLSEEEMLEVLRYVRWLVHFRPR